MVLPGSYDVSTRTTKKHTNLAIVKKSLPITEILLSNTATSYGDHNSMLLEEEKWNVPIGVVWRNGEIKDLKDFARLSLNCKYDEEEGFSIHCSRPQRRMAVECSCSTNHSRDGHNLPWSILSVLWKSLKVWNGYIPIGRGTTGCFVTHFFFIAVDWTRSRNGRLLFNEYSLYDNTMCRKRSYCPISS